MLAIVLAGGEGKRLMPLTADRAKPAVPFAGIYRLIDFALSNVVNSGYLQVVVLTQYKSHSLDRHVTQTWRMSTMLGNYVTPVPAQQRVGKRWYLGSADAIFQSLNLIHDERPDIIVVVGADHVYRMDFSQMVEQHVESGAPCTVAAIRQPIGLADQFGVIDVQPDDPTRIRDFLEKPTDPVGLPDSPLEVLASMGNYVFDSDALVEAVTRDAEIDDSAHDMGGDIVPAFVRREQAGVYDFKDNLVPGSTDRDRGYWRDVGTMGSYYAAHMDVVSPLPIFNLYNFDWPIYTSYGPQPPVKVVQGEGGMPAMVGESVLSPGGVISGGTVDRSVLSPEVRVGTGAEVTDSVLLHGVRVGTGAIVRNAILDKYVEVPPGAQVGVDPEADRARGFVVEDGLTVLGKYQRFPSDDSTPHPRAKWELCTLEVAVPLAPRRDTCHLGPARAPPRACAGATSWGVGQAKDAGCPGRRGVGVGQRGDRLVGVEAAGVGHHPQLGAGQRLGLPSRRRPAYAECGAVGGDPGDRDDPRPDPADQLGERRAALAQLGVGQLGRPRGRAADQVGDADPPGDEVGTVVVGHAGGGVDAPLEDPGEGERGIEAVDRVGEVGLRRGGPQPRVDADEEQPAAGSEQVGDLGVAVGLQLVPGEAGHGSVDHLEWSLRGRAQPHGRIIAHRRGALPAPPLRAHSPPRRASRSSTD